MNIRLLNTLLLSTFTLALTSNIYSQQATAMAPDHFNKFNNVEGGWLASDATISLLLPDGKTLWLFGDCFIGKKSGEFSIDPNNSTMINNAAIIDDGEKMISYYGGPFENPSSLIPGIGADIFWPEHATIENDTIKIFAIQIIHEDNGVPGFNFKIGRTHLAYFKYPEMQHVKTELIEYITDSTMRFGTHVLKRDDFTYIFGKKDTTINGFKYPLPVLARVSKSVSEPWEFYAGDGNWSYDCKNTKVIGDRPMSESFFVYESNSKFYLIMHEIWSVGALYILESDNITGPWNRAITGGIENRFCLIPKHGSNFTYNLFAHPHFQNDGKILISFNVNTRDFYTIFSDTKNYRARFLWLSVEEAISITKPDTVYIFENVTDISEKEIDLEKNIRDQHLETFANKIVLKNITSPAILSVYSIDGKILLYRNIGSDSILYLDDFPNSLLIIKLQINGNLYTKKMLKTS